MKKLLALIVGMLVLASCEQKSREQVMTPDEVKQTVWALTSEYDAGIPVILFENDTKNLAHDNTLAQTVCRLDGSSCYIIFRNCALYDKTIKELAIHEASHVVVAVHEMLFDHGYEWQKIMKENGIRNPKPGLHNLTCNY